MPALSGHLCQELEPSAPPALESSPPKPPHTLREVKLERKPSLPAAEADEDQDHFVSTIFKTSLACVAAAVATYPITQWNLAHQTKSLGQWADEEFAPRERSQFRRVLSPMSRLLFQELALQITENTTRTAVKVDEGLGKELLEEVAAGAISGVALALLLSPLAARQAEERQRRDMASRSKQFKRMAYMLGFALGKSDLAVVDPADRLQRAYRGISLLAAREVSFNITFFPLSYYFKHSIGELWLTSVEREKLRDSRYYFSLDNLVLWRANVVAGAVCSVLVTPMDVLRTYYWHSGQRWSFWTGKSVLSPPWALLFRGWAVQALIIGPSFGTVATIYEWKY